MSIAGIAAYFSVIGLATIFAGAFLGVIVMAGALEFGKIVTAAYLHLYWDRLNYMKYYLTFSVFILMLITSLGIFGYLAKASSDTSYQTAIAQSEIQKIDDQIARTDNSISLLGERMNFNSSPIEWTGWSDQDCSIASCSNKEKLISSLSASLSLLRKSAKRLQKTPPFVMFLDVYSAAHRGRARGGWTAPWLRLLPT